MTQSTFLDRLQVALGDEKIHAFARRSGISDSTLRQYEKGSMPGLPKLIEIAEATRTTIDWLATGREPMRLTGASNIQVPIVSDEDIPGFTLVPRLDIQASAGPGAFGHDEQVIDYLAFQESWLRARKINPSGARVLTAKGDSMEPTIRNGDVLLVDTTINYIQDNTIYVIVYGDILLVKRVHSRFNGTLQLISDNPLYPPEEVTAGEIEQLHVAGRVMWFGRSI